MLERAIVKRGFRNGKKEREYQSLSLSFYYSSFIYFFSVFSLSFGPTTLPRDLGASPIHAHVHGETLQHGTRSSRASHQSCYCVDKGAMRRRQSRLRGTMAPLT